MLAHPPPAQQPSSQPGPWDSHGKQVSGMLTASEQVCQAATQIWDLSAATGKAFTTVLAGFAFTLISWPKAILTPALVAGFTRVLILARPGIVKIPFFFTSVVARVAKLSMSPEHPFVFSSCCSARVLIRAPLVMTLPAFAFIAFFIGAMVAGTRLELMTASELAALE